MNTYRSEQTYNQQRLKIILTAALAQVISQHPALCCGLHGEASRHPSYVLADTINLAHQLVFRSLPPGVSLLQHLEIEHNDSWPAQERTPPWKVIVFQCEQGDPRVIDVAFIYHHAVGDGMSGAAFHTALLSSLTDICSRSHLPTEPVRQVAVTPPLSLRPPIEELVKFKTSWGFLAGQVLQEYGPRIFGRSEEPYSALPCQDLDTLPFRTELRLLEIDTQTVKVLLSKCRPKISMTALLSANLAMSIALAVSSATKLLGQITYTLRRVSGTDYQSMVNETSAVEIDYEKNLLDHFRDRHHDYDVPGLAQLVMEEAEENSVQMRDAIDDCLNNNLVGLLPYVADHHEFYRKKLGKKREKTFEVSNIGAIKPQADSGGAWKIERAIFTQGAAIVGPALNLMVASVIDGPMTLIFSWQQGIIEESVVADVITMFETTLKTIANS